MIEPDAASDPAVRSLHSIPVFYDDRMVAQTESFSPSAGKPREVVESWKRFSDTLTFPDFGPVTFEHLCRAHSPEFVLGVLRRRLKNGFGNTHEAVARSVPWTCGAMLAAAREAIDNRAVAVAPVSGFHHACFEEAMDFCTFNGLMVTALTLQAEALAERVGILDYDMHYGNGTVDILETLKPRGIEHHTEGDDFRTTAHAEGFLRAIPERVRSFGQCDVLLYQAGADPHVDDPLGGWLSSEQLAERDALVFATCREIGLPVAWNLAGGYQKPLRKVLDIHDATMAACIATFLPGLQEA